MDKQERALVAQDCNSPEQREHAANWLREELPFLVREKPWVHATIEDKAGAIAQCERRLVRMEVTAPSVHSDAERWC